MKPSLKNQLSYLFFILLAVLAFYTVFQDNDLGMVIVSLKNMKLPYLLLSAAAALIFTMMEGVMIWYLLRALQGKAQFLPCIRYSFVGFLYSGITPSATGGQPMQLYHMNRDGNSLSASTVVLMTVALVYKLVLVVMGLLMVVFQFPVLKEHLGKYVNLFYLGIFLNTALVVVLLVVMIFPKSARCLIIAVENLLVSIRLLKKSEATVLQRCLVFILPYIVYRGFGLEGTGALTIFMVQMSIYLAVDMLPLPGAQGITELMYRRVFRDIFTAEYVVPSMCVSRGISFYFLLFFSMAVCVIHHMRFRMKKI